MGKLPGLNVGIMILAKLFVRQLKNKKKDIRSIQLESKRENSEGLMRSNSKSNSLEENDSNEKSYGELICFIKINLKLIGKF